MTMTELIVVGPLRRLFARRHFGPGAHPSGSDQEVHAGGSAAKEKPGSREMGLSPQRKGQFTETEERSEIGRFFDDLRQIKGAEILSASIAQGGFKESPEAATSYEQSVDTVYTGNGEIEAATAENARRWNQWGTFIFSDERLSSARGEESVATRFMFDQPLSPTMRASVENTLAEHGTNGWAWKQRGGRDLLVSTALPQWGYGVDTHTASMRALAGRLSSQNVRFSTWDRNGWAITAKKDDDYEWR